MTLEDGIALASLAVFVFAFGCLDPAVTDYALSEPAHWPRCRGDVMEKTWSSSENKKPVPVALVDGRRNLSRAHAVFIPWKHH